MPCRWDELIAQRLPLAPGDSLELPFALCGLVGYSGADVVLTYGHAGDDGGARNDNSDDSVLAATAAATAAAALPAVQRTTLLMLRTDVRAAVSTLNFHVGPLAPAAAAAAADGGSATDANDRWLLAFDVLNHTALPIELDAVVSPAHLPDPHPLRERIVAAAATTPAAPLVPLVLGRHEMRRVLLPLPRFSLPADRLDAELPDDPTRQYVVTPMALRTPAERARARRLFWYTLAVRQAVQLRWRLAHGDAHGECDLEALALDEEQVMQLLPSPVRIGVRVRVRRDDDDDDDATARAADAAWATTGASATVPVGVFSELAVDVAAHAATPPTAPLRLSVLLYRDCGAGGHDRDVDDALLVVGSRSTILPPSALAMSRHAVHRLAVMPLRPGTICVAASVQQLQEHRPQQQQQQPPQQDRSADNVAVDSVWLHDSSHIVRHRPTLRLHATLSEHR